MKAHIYLLLAAAIVAASAQPGLATPEEDYQFYLTVEQIDDSCRYLKFAEREYIEKEAGKAQRRTAKHAEMIAGTIERDAFFDWDDAVIEQAKASAQSLGCTQQAGPYLLKARELASAVLMQDMMLALHLHNLDKQDFSHTPLSELQIRSINGFSGFLQQVYGANFQNFYAQQQQNALARLPVTFENPLLGLSDGEDPFGVSGMFGTDPAMETMMQIISETANSVRAVVFEVAFEAAGYRALRSRENASRRISLVSATTGDVWGDVVEGPRSFYLGDLKYADGEMVVRPDDTLELVLHGAKMPGETQVAKATLLVNEQPIPEGTEPYEVFDLPDWRTNATVFEGTLNTTDCPAGVCWQFPIEATDALLDGDYRLSAELYLTADPDAVVPDDHSLRIRNRIQVVLLNELLFF